MGRIVIRRKSGGAPSSLALDGLWQDYASSPLLGRASVGPSLGRNASEATHPPTASSALNGHAGADFDGTNQELSVAGAANDYMSDSAWYGWFLFRADAAGAMNLVEPYLEPGIFCDRSGSFGITFSDSGFGLFRFGPSVGWKSVRATCPTGAVHIGTFAWDAATSTLKVGIDGPPNTTQFCLPTDNFLSLRTMVMGRNFDSLAFFDGQVWEGATTHVPLAYDDFTGIVAVANARYGLSLSPPSNFESGTYSGSSSTVHSYVGTRVTDSADFSQRDGAKLHFFSGKYRLLGGWRSSPYWGADQTTNEIWSSTNLVDWTLDLAHDPAPPTSGAGARWTKRHAFGTCELGGYLYVIGADQYEGGTPDVWRSADCVTWERRCAVAPWGPRVGLCVGTYGSEIHVIGGAPIEASVFYSALPTHYVSSDGGATWTQLPDPPFATSFCTAIWEHDGVLLVCGGDAGGVQVGRVYSNSVWAWNGTKWRQQCAAAPWSGRMWVDQVIYDGKLWVLPGRDSDTTDAHDAWYSGDAGQTWTQVAEAPWPGTHADGVCATVADGIVLASGYGVNQNVYTLKVAP